MSPSPRPTCSPLPPLVRRSAPRHLGAPEAPAAPQGRTASTPAPAKRAPAVRRCRLCMSTDHIANRCPGPQRRGPVSHLPDVALMRLEVVAGVAELAARGWVVVGPASPSDTGKPRTLIERRVSGVALGLLVIETLAEGDPTP